LRALASRLRKTRDTRVAIGLMLSTSYWTKEPRMASFLGAMTSAALSELSCHECFVYSENGEFDQTSALLLPISTQTLTCISELETARGFHTRAQELRMGYFGRPSLEKGFNSITEVIGTGLMDGRTDVTFDFFLPPTYAIVSNQISQLSPVVRTSACFRDNRRYIEDMMSVDVVLCFYDPGFYGLQMSGIVTEAALLGKATLVVKNTSLHRFLDRNSPGSCCAIDFSHDALRRALTQPADVWRDKQWKAVASMKVVRELKRAERFFAVAFGLKPTEFTAARS